MAEKFDANLTPERRLIRQRMAERNLTLNALSEQLGKNQAYMHQYLKVGKPQRLPEDVRHQIAHLLDLPEEALRSDRAFLSGGSTEADHALRSLGEARERRSSHVVDGDPRGWQAPRAPASISLPLYNVPGQADPAHAIEWVERPGHYVGTGTAFAIWVPEDAGRIRTGDLAFVRPTQPPAIGDAVVVSATNRLLAVGELIASGGSEFVVSSNSGRKTFSSDEHVAMRVVAVAFR